MKSDSLISILPINARCNAMGTAVVSSRALKVARQVGITPYSRWKGPSCAIVLVIVHSMISYITRRMISSSIKSVIRCSTSIILLSVDTLTKTLKTHSGIKGTSVLSTVPLTIAWKLPAI